MNQQITDKTYCILVRGGYKVYIREDQFKNIQASLAELEVINLDQGFIFRSSVIGILLASEIETQDKIKRGDWKCAYGEFHSRGQECGHKTY